MALVVNRFTKIWFDVIMFCYSFTLISVVHFFALSRAANEYVFDKYCLTIIACFGAVEVINQISFFLAKRNRKLAIKFKILSFWIIFTVGIVIYMLIVSRLPKIDDWVWHKKALALLLYSVLCWALPGYSKCPDVRFLFLYGKFKTK